MGRRHESGSSREQQRGSEDAAPCADGPGAKTREGDQKWWTDEVIRFRRTLSQDDLGSVGNAVGRKSITGGVCALGSDRIQFDLEFDGVRYRPTLKRSPTEANLKRARKQLVEIRQRIAAGTFVFEEEFPDYRSIKNGATPKKRRTCDQVFDEFLIGCDSRVAKKDLAFVTAQG